MTYKLTEQAKQYNYQCNDIMQDLLDDGFLKRDVVAGLNHCAEIESMDVGDELVLFIKGILFERKRKLTSLFAKEKK